MTPLYSMVPAGLIGATQAYKDAYGATPDPTKAKAVLAAAGITTPVNITIWWTPSHYGAVSGDEYTEIKRELEATGLFKVTLQSAEWDAYSKAYPRDQYEAFELGWFPDYPDADDYLAPFYLKGGFYNNHYDNPAIDTLLTQEEGETDATKRLGELQQIQTLAAEDVPTIPVWQGNQVAATGLTNRRRQDVRPVVHLPDVAHRQELVVGRRGARISGPSAQRHLAQNRKRYPLAATSRRSLRRYALATRVVIPMALILLTVALADAGRAW